MSRRLQHHVVDGHTIDLDIQNCCLTLLQQIISKTAPQPPMPDDLVQLMDRLVKDRAGVLKELSLHTVEGKEMINTVLNGGSPPTSLRNNEIVQSLQKKILVCEVDGMQFASCRLHVACRQQAKNISVFYHPVSFVDFC